MKIFLFAFKLACLLLMCSMPYNITLLISLVGGPLPVFNQDILNFLRFSYHFIDSWVFCINTDLRVAMKAMVAGRRNDHFNDTQNVPG